MEDSVLLHMFALSLVGQLLKCVHLIQFLSVFVQKTLKGGNVWGFFVIYFLRNSTIAIIILSGISSWKHEWEIGNKCRGQKNPLNIWALFCLYISTSICMWYKWYIWQGVDSLSSELLILCYFFSLKRHIFSYPYAFYVSMANLKNSLIKMHKFNTFTLYCSPAKTLWS